MKFSVTIPAYKRAYLRECIESVLAQTYADFELVIVDDHSPEDLAAVVKQFDDKRIRFFRNDKNCGAVDVVDNWNICLAHATGDYLICMGDDDRLLPNCLEEYARLIAKYPGLGIYHAQTEIIDSKSEFYDMTASRAEWESVYTLIWNRWQCGRLQFIGDFLFDVPTLRNNGGFYKLPLAWGSDDISAVMAAAKSGIANSQTPIFQYRSNAQTISNPGNYRIKIEATLAEKHWYEKFLDTEPAEAWERKYWLSCRKNLESRFRKVVITEIASDLKYGFLGKMWHYAANCKRYELSRTAMTYAIYTGFFFFVKRFLKL